MLLNTRWYHSAYSCKKQVYLGGRLDHRQDVPRHLEEFEELVVPFESLEVHEHGARGVGDVGDVGSVQSSVLCCKCFGRLGKKMVYNHPDTRGIRGLMSGRVPLKLSEDRRPKVEVRGQF